MFTALFSALFSALPAQAFETRATSAFVLDQNTGTVLLNKNADTPLPPASMSKLMTLYVAFEAIRDGQLSMTEELPVSQHAMNYGGSTLFLKTGERVKVEDLIRGIIVLSGNDACAVIAEALSPDGTEAGFARLMTRRAVEMGMTNSTFMNSNGWPQEGHLMSARDLALLANRIITDFPEFYPMFSEQEFLFDANERSNRFNRNPLLGLGIGADGLKTGHTQQAGYGLVGSAKQDGRRVIFVISGLGSQEARAEEAESIVNWAFRQFAEVPLIRSGTLIAEAPVWMGEAQKVGLVPAEDQTILLPVRGVDDVDAEAVFRSPIQAPVAQGQQLGELIFTPEGLEEVRVPLVAAEDVPAGGFMTRITTAARILFQQWQDAPADAS
ncbi:D-alanyl-D-alanine carboxypeptidase [Aliishimia ponticola]|uniref:serine-type D-Ala-D-Ala carboxypeptidase n=1 Tax=Aliishimia ponticola TaxID=2499833 RepID=A0A4S4NDC8_9RHOB|nr:D-alanyl-D-alanine carboxypeptidase family protein [Aliishimia ponticola]THH37506.1 D-alanyl-D-alanine carboxypeptidase [Aliishimia ponticola]